MLPRKPSTYNNMKIIETSTRKLVETDKKTLLCTCAFKRKDTISYSVKV